MGGEPAPQPSGDGSAPRVRSYVSTAVRTYLLAMGITAAFAMLAMMLPPDVNPYLASIVVLGLLLGPFGCLGATTVSFILNLLFGFPLELCLLDLLTTFIVSYLPYRMWYGTLTGGAPAAAPSMNTVRDISKFFAVMIVTSVLYTVLYHYSYGLIYGSRSMWLTDLANLLSVLTFTLVIGMSLTLLFRHRGTALYRPYARFARDDLRRRVNPLAFDVLLAAGIAMGALAMTDAVPFRTEAVAAAYVLIVAYLLKPVPADEDGSARRQGRYDFDNSIIERIILIFVIIGLVLSVVSGVGAYMGVLVDILDVGSSLSMTFYIGATCLTFFAVSLMVLWYIERRVSVPLSDISRAARGFVDDREGMSGDETVGEYMRYQGYGSEIGVLARSLTDMTRDIETYVEDIRTLNSARERYEAELSMAMSIQVSLVPRNFSSVSPMGMEVCGEMRAAKWVGGDLYDFFAVDDGHVAVAIADVSGKGMPAALLMAVTRSLLRSHVVPGAHPSEVLSRVNAAIYEDNDQGMFVTAWLGIVDVGTGEVEFATAGHCPPVLSRCGSQPELLRTRPGMVLGGREGSRYRDETVVLSPGDRIVLYTDGVTEANDSYQGFYGEDRLMSVVEDHAGGSVEDVVRAVVDDVLDFTGESDQFDDITTLVAEYTGRRSEPPSDA